MLSVEKFIQNKGNLLTSKVIKECIGVNYFFGFFVLILKKVFVKISNLNWEDKTILVVEDDHINFKLIEFCLKRTGAKVLLADNGLDSVEICRTNKDIDAVLMDIRLPKLSGIDATRILRKEGNVVPVILQSAFLNDFRGNQEIMKLFDSHLGKPLSLKCLYLFFAIPLKSMKNCFKIPNVNIIQLNNCLNSIAFFHTN